MFAWCWENNKSLFEKTFCDVEHFEELNKTSCNIWPHISADDSVTYSAGKSHNTDTAAFAGSSWNPPPPQLFMLFLNRHHIHCSFYNSVLIKAIQRESLRSQSNNFAVLTVFLFCSPTCAAAPCLMWRADIQTRSGLWCPPGCPQSPPSWGEGVLQPRWGRRSPSPAWSRCSALAHGWPKGRWAVMWRALSKCERAVR